MHPSGHCWKQRRNLDCPPFSWENLPLSLSPWNPPIVYVPVICNQSPAVPCIQATILQSSQQPSYIPPIYPSSQSCLLGHSLNPHYTPEIQSATLLYVPVLPPKQARFTGTPLWSGYIPAIQFAALLRPWSGKPGLLTPSNFICSSKEAVNR